MTEVQRLNEFLTLAPALVLDNKPLLSWLADAGFFAAPASTKYHGAHPGGLYEHSRQVFRALNMLTEKLGLAWIRPESPFIIGMFHDLCKIDQYREVVDDPGEVMMGSDEPVGYKSHYEYADTLITGHGDKSVIYLARFLTLTEEEILCIRFHMGAFTGKDDWPTYTRAVNQCPNVLYTHHADMLASHVEGV